MRDMMKRKAPKFEVYKARDGWRWRLRAGNNAITAESGEAYVRKPTYKLMQKIFGDILEAEFVVTP